MLQYRRILELHFKGTNQSLIEEFEKNLLKSVDIPATDEMRR